MSQTHKKFTDIGCKFQENLHKIKTEPENEELSKTIYDDIEKKKSNSGFKIKIEEANVKAVFRKFYQSPIIIDGTGATVSVKEECMDNVYSGGEVKSNFDRVDIKTECFNNVDEHPCIEGYSSEQTGNKHATEEVFLEVSKIDIDNSDDKSDPLESIEHQSYIDKEESKETCSSLQIGTQDHAHTCDVCNKGFSLKSNLVVHKRIHTGETPYECDVCYKRFRQKSRIVIHKRIHTGEKLHVCDICNKRFTQKNALVVHKRIHTGETPYECDVCNKRFKDLSQCTRHKRTHTGESPYECDVCNKKFKVSSDVTKHKRIHTGEKPYVCDVCNKRFTQKSALVVHKRTHTGETPYECDVCSKRFKDLSQCTRHKRTHW